MTLPPYRRPLAAFLIALLAASLPGCVDAPVDSAVATPAPAGSDVDPATSAPLEAGVAPEPLTLYLTSDLALVGDAPASESAITIGVPVNGPWADSSAYPYFDGILPRETPRAAATLVLYVTTNAASARASNLVVFADLPGVLAILDAAGSESEGSAETPPVILAGDVHELRIEYDLGKDPAAAGKAIALQLVPFHTHAKAAAEFRFLVGGHHASRIELR